MSKVLIYVYGVLLLAGAVLFFFYPMVGRYVFGAGALVAIVESFMSTLRHRSDNITIARRHRLYFVASLFLGIATWFMFFTPKSNNWVIMTLIWAIIVFYLSFRPNKDKND